MAFSEITDKLTIKVSRLYPVCKDWNETLQHIINEVKPLEDVRKEIRFIDSRYHELFRIKDGDAVKITRFDGEVFVKDCRFIDDCHLYIGNDAYHICEFAELMERNGNKYEAAERREPILHILSAKYGEKLQDWGVAMTEAALRKLVGGKYTTETLYSPNRNEQIKDRIVEIKGIAMAVLLRGKDGIAVCGIGGDDNATPTSLHPYWAQKYKRELSPAQRAEPEAETLLGEVAEAKTRVASHPVNDRTTPRSAPEAR